MAAARNGKSGLLEKVRNLSFIVSLGFKIKSNIFIFLSCLSLSSTADSQGFVVHINGVFTSRFRCPDVSEANGLRYQACVL